ncbi:hypothetical protein I4F81_012130 [Pyropia yezoensis]|uniref:Uncharacterized protein n=1 Tax=Pyropia yezoensis TaxID=2788 RepID=A0ACC3CI89_PYRYE|nr:hypothetical protein I4F81_012130 [Neopyropia yezoensis]
MPTGRPASDDDVVCSDGEGGEEGPDAAALDALDALEVADAADAGDSADHAANNGRGQPARGGVATGGAAGRPTADPQLTAIEAELDPAREQIADLEAGLAAARTAVRSALSRHEARPVHLQQVADAATPTGPPRRPSRGPRRCGGCCGTRLG